MKIKSSFKCLSSFNWNYQTSISCFHEDTDPMCNTKFPFHIFWDIDPRFNTNIPIHVFWKRLIPYYQISIPWFLIDIDLILQNYHFMFLDIDPIVKICSKNKRIFRLVRARLFRSVRKFGVPRFWSFQKEYFSKMCRASFLKYVELFGVSKVTHNRFRESWTRPKIPKPCKWRVFGFPKINTKNY